MDKKYFYYGLGFIAVFLILILMDKAFTTQYKSEPNKKGSVQTQVTKIKVSATPTKAPKLIINDTRIYSNNDKERVVAYLNSFMEVINKKNYKLAYEVLKDDYKKDRFYDLQTFQKYMQKTYKRQYIIDIKTLDKKDDVFIVTANLVAKQYNPDEIIKGIKYNQETFTIEEANRGDFTVAFGNFIKSTKIESDNKINNTVTIRTVKQTIYTDNIKYTLLVKNESDKPLYLLKDINKPNIYLSDLLGNKIETDRTQLYITNTKANAKEPTLVEISFPNYYTNKFMPFKISFENTNYDSKNFIKMEIPAE